MNGAPEDVVGMAAEREGARRRGDFAAADALRARILEAGFAVTDTAAGPVLAPAEVMPPIRLRPHEVGGMLDRPAVFDASVHWLVQGWPEDVVRGTTERYREAARRICGISLS